MFGFRYVKASPTTYVIQYRDGKPVREGLGLSFWYFSPTSSLVAVPVQSADVPFMFKEVSSDFQEVSIQGQATFRVVDAKALAAMLNFTLKPDGATYQSDDPLKLPLRVVNAVQVQVKSIVQGMTLQQLLRTADKLVDAVRGALTRAPGLAALGVEVSDLAILAVKPNPDTARALEATVRETILQQADDAIYVRRNSSIEQERQVKENELKTEIAVEQKKREIRETQLEAERAVLTKRQEIQRQDLEGRVEQEGRRKALVELASANARQESDARAYGVATMMKAVEKVDARVVQALMLSGADPATLIASAFQGLADNAQKVGELNISPDLLKQLVEKKKPG